MPFVRLQSHVPYTMAQVLQTILDVEAYPLFLPGCHGVRLIQKNQTSLVSEMRVAQNWQLVTTMRWDEKQVWFANPCVQGSWILSDGASGTHIDLSIDCVHAGVFSPVVRALLPHYLPTMRDFFEKRLHALYRSKYLK